MSQIKSLSAQQLRSFCELAEFDFATTEDVPDFDGMIGQNRAIEALSFAMEMEKPGYNMYLMGPNGLGKHALLKRFLAEKSEEKNSAQDWLYVFNFDEPNKPKLINLPASQGKSFKKDMQSLLDSLDNTLLDLFNTKKNKENA